MVKFNVNSVNLIFTFTFEKNKRNKMLHRRRVDTTASKMSCVKGATHFGRFEANQRALLLKKKKKNRQWAGGRSGPQPTEWVLLENRMVHSKPI